LYNVVYLVAVVYYVLVIVNYVCCRFVMFIYWTSS